MNTRANKYATINERLGSACRADAASSTIAEEGDSDDMLTAEEIMHEVSNSSASINSSSATNPVFDSSLDKTQRLNNVEEYENSPKVQKQVNRSSVSTSDLNNLKNIIDNSSEWSFRPSTSKSTSHARTSQSTSQSASQSTKHKRKHVEIEITSEESDSASQAKKIKKSTARGKSTKRLVDSDDSSDDSLIKEKCAPRKNVPTRSAKKLNDEMPKVKRSSKKNEKSRKEQLEKNSPPKKRNSDKKRRSSSSKRPEHSQCSSRRSSSIARETLPEMELILNSATSEQSVEDKLEHELDKDKERRDFIELWDDEDKYIREHLKIPQVKFNTEEAINVLRRLGYDTIALNGANTEINDITWSSDIIGHVPKFTTTTPRNHNHTGAVVAIVGADSYQLHSGNRTPFRNHPGQLRLMHFRCGKAKCNANIYVDKNGIIQRAQNDHSSHWEKRRFILYWQKLKENALKFYYLPNEKIVAMTNDLGILKPVDHPLPATSRQRVLRSRKSLLETSSWDGTGNLARSYFGGIVLHEGEIIHADGFREKYVIVGSRMLLRMLALSRIWSCDGTFKCTTGSYTQTYIIMGKLSPFDDPNTEDEDKVRERNALKPCIYIMMKSKSQEAYTQVFNKLKELIQDELNMKYNGPKSIMIDMEQAVHNAFEEVFNGVSITYCLFHWIQMLYKRCFEDRAFAKALRNKNNSAWVVFNRLKSLPSYPADQIPKAFYKLQENPAMAIAESVMQHLEKNYITGRFKPKYWSQFDNIMSLSNRTTNYNEGLHSKLNKHFFGKNSMVDILYNFEVQIVRTETEREQAMEGQFTRRHKNHRFTYYKMLRNQKALRFFLIHNTDLNKRVNDIHLEHDINDFITVTVFDKDIE